VQLDRGDKVVAAPAVVAEAKPEEPKGEEIV
jgi:hypothetical protein